MSILNLIAVSLCTLPLHLAGCASSPQHQSLTIAHTFKSSPHQTNNYPVLIDTPENFNPNTSFAIILYHGGYLSDPHWTVPGTYTQDGQEIPITINSKPTTDADTLATALLANGYAVIRYGSININKDQAQPSPISFPQTVELAQQVLKATRENLAISPARCITLGHSLGATRAAITAPDAAAHIILAGAYITPTMTSPFSLAQNAQANTSAEDYDHSGTIDPFEQAAHHAITNNTTKTHDLFTNNNHTYPWPSDTLIESNIPTLALWGSLDPTSYHGPVLEHLFKQANKHHLLTTHYFPQRGHNLSTQENNRIDKIDPAVIQTIINWLSEHFPT